MNGEEIGLRLRLLRIKSGIQLKDAAKRAGCAIHTLCRIEKGKQKFSRRLLLRLLSIYDGDEKKEFYKEFFERDLDGILKAFPGEFEKFVRCRGLGKKPLKLRI